MSKNESMIRECVKFVMSPSNFFLHLKILFSRNYGKIGTLLAGDLLDYDGQFKICMARFDL